MIYAYADPEPLQQPSTSDGIFLETCVPGQCPTNIFNGVKRCPEDLNQSSTAQVGIEVCNSAFACENVETPFAVQGDQSTNLSGLCPLGVQCRCLRPQQCSEFTVAYFKTSQGNPFLPPQGQRLTFEQLTTYTNVLGEDVITPPFQIGRDPTSFCTISNEWVSRITPSKCLQGVLAYVPDDPGNFDFNAAVATPLSCMVGTDCQFLDERAVWDNRINQTTCKLLCKKGQRPFWNEENNNLECLKLCSNDERPLLTSDGDISCVSD